MADAAARALAGGRTAVRTVPYMATLTAIRGNPGLQAHYARLVERGRPKQVAPVACVRKPLGILNAIVRDQTPMANRLTRKTVAQPLGRALPQVWHGRRSGHGAVAAQPSGRRKRSSAPPPPALPRLPRRTGPAPMPGLRWSSWRASCRDRWADNQRVRPRVEEIFGRVRTAVGGRKLRDVGPERDQSWMEPTTATYNLVRIAAIEEMAA